MKSLAAQLAAAVRDEINSQTFDLPFVAVTGFVPVYPLEALQSLCVTVVPRQLERDAAARGLVALRLTVDVAVQRAVTPDPADPSVVDGQVDEIIALAESIANHMTMRRLSAGSRVFQWTGCQHAPMVLPDQLLDQQVASSVASLIYQTSLLVTA